MKNNQKETEMLMKTATFCSVGVAVSIIIIKLIAWILTDSLSLLSSLVDSFFDVFASLVSFMAVRYALQPADEDHRFGHGKAEDIAAFSQSTFIAGSGFFILVEAIGRLVNPQPIDNEIVGIVVMLVSSILTMGLIMIQKYVIRKTNSSAIKADSLHYQTDLLVNLLVICSFAASLLFNITLLDPVFAVLIALYIFRGAYQVGRNAFDKLMDKEFSDEDRAKITQAVISHKKVLGMHDLRTRSSGIKPFIQLHLELDGNIKLKEAHDISEEVETAILEIFPDAEVLVHQDIEVTKELHPLKGRVVPAEKR